MEVQWIWPATNRKKTPFLCGWKRQLCTDYILIPNSHFSDSAGMEPTGMVKEYGNDLTSRKTGFKPFLPVRLDNKGRIGYLDEPNTAQRSNTWRINISGLSFIRDHTDRQTISDLKPCA